MIYFLETELYEKSLVFVALQKIYGIGKFHSIYFCKKAGFSLNCQFSELSSDQLKNLNGLIKTSKILINSDLIKLKKSSFKNLIEIKSYRGLRKLQGYPVRGQRTRSNAKTSKKQKN